MVLAVRLPRCSCAVCAQARKLMELRIQDPQKYFQHMGGSAAAVKADPEAAAALADDGDPLTALGAVASEHARLRAAGGDDGGGAQLGLIAPTAAAAALQDIQSCSHVDGEMDAGGRRQNPVAGAALHPSSPKLELRSVSVDCNTRHTEPRPAGCVEVDCALSQGIPACTDNVHRAGGVGALTAGCCVQCCCPR